MRSRFAVAWLTVAACRLCLLFLLIVLEYLAKQMWLLFFPFFCFVSCWLPAVKFDRRGQTKSKNKFHFGGPKSIQMRRFKLTVPLFPRVLIIFLFFCLFVFKWLWDRVISPYSYVFDWGLCPGGLAITTALEFCWLLSKCAQSYDLHGGDVENVKMKVVFRWIFIRVSSSFVGLSHEWKRPARIEWSVPLPSVLTRDKWRISGRRNNLNVGFFPGGHINRDRWNFALW